MTLPRRLRPRRVGFASTSAARLAVGCLLALASRGAVLAKDGGADPDASVCRECARMAAMPAAAPVSREAWCFAGTVVLGAGVIASVIAVGLHWLTRKASEEERSRHLRRSLGSYPTLRLWDELSRVLSKVNKGSDVSTTFIRIQDYLAAKKTVGLADLKAITTEVSSLPKFDQQDESVGLLNELQKSFASVTVPPAGRE